MAAITTLDKFPLDSAEIVWLAYLQERPRGSFADAVGSLENLVALTPHKDAGAWIFERLREAERVFSADMRREEKP